MLRAKIASLVFVLIVTAQCGKSYSLGGAKPVQLSVGGEHACALLSSWKVKCWGNNALSAKQFGQLGGGTNKKSAAAPVTVVGLK